MLRYALPGLYTFHPAGRLLKERYREQPRPESA